MEKNLENSDWMKDAPKLVALRNKNPFNVPDGYFEESETNILNAIFIDNLKENYKSGFCIPQNYFENLPTQIESKIALDKLLALKKEDFTVPQNYFEEFESKLNARIGINEVKRKTKILRLWQSNIMRYASVACFVILSASGIYYYQNANIYIPQAQTTDFSNDQMLYDIDENVIIDNIEATTPSPKIISASDTEMENYILNNYSSTELVQELKQ
ncbi:hypothetical protein EZJ43_15300 [Pedobacter changchengzhani]|uniref:Uncharacterized protein n=1 Tax=Pedobacter changchengzhani TaxID=2529274 RepID=A0A4R5MHQ6_9SPHI|nr:hypothetical protein [Pedobacter changchengzhani]TDG35090.1 hypothetical protein EZJ43_15300 [Pedobacter changchengzhani]